MVFSNLIRFKLAAKIVVLTEQEHEDDINTNVGIISFKELGKKNCLKNVATNIAIV